MQRPTIAKKLPTFSQWNRLSKTHKITVAGAAGAAALVLTVTGLEATAGAAPANAAGSTATGTFTKGALLKAPATATGTTGTGAAPKGTLHPAAKPAPEKHEIAAAKKKATHHKATPAAKKKAAPKHAAPAHTAKHTEHAKKHAEHTKKRVAHVTKHVKHVSHVKQHARTKPAASRHTTRAKLAASYPDNLNGWIRESLAIMRAHGIPGSYEGIHRNIIRESSGNPRAINLWDINARNGIPSKGLLQVIDPTFNRYHVSGTSTNIYDPVANITAACNYAADRYGSMDNVNSAY